METLIVILNITINIYIKLLYKKKKNLFDHYFFLQDFNRQLEINLAIMHELRVRRPVVVPVFLLPQFVTPAEQVS